jgi:hypothetical protein
MLQSRLHDRPGVAPGLVLVRRPGCDPAAFRIAVSATLTQTRPGRWLDEVELEHGRRDPQNQYHRR